jgi:chromosome segregation ATPase
MTQNQPDRLDRVEEILVVVATQQRVNTEAIAQLGDKIDRLGSRQEQFQMQIENLSSRQEQFQMQIENLSSRQSAFCKINLASGLSVLSISF